jgi:large conductance mechanosensitive channel
LVDIAVAFVIGVATAGLINTFIGKIVNPLLGLIFNTGSLDGSIPFGKVVDGVQQGSVGSFIGAIINFLVIAFVMFMVVKAYNKMKKPAEAAGPPEDITLLKEIRDALTK